MKRKPYLCLLAAVLLLCVLSACALPSAGTGGTEEEAEEYVQYRESLLPVEPDVTGNPFAEEEFAVGDDGRIAYTGTAYAAQTVIDVSSHQGEVDWAAVAAAGVSGVMLRVGYRGYGSAGNIKADDRFAANIRGALAAGLQVGVYFYSQAVSEAEAREEADFVLDAVKGYDLTLPAAFDWEYITTDEARTDGVTSEELTAFAAAFCGEIAAGGLTPMIYFNQDTAYMLYRLGELTEYAFWLAEYAAYPSFYYGFAMWQYSSSGTVDGIGVTVDLNLYFTKK